MGTQHYNIGYFVNGERIDLLNTYNAGIDKIDEALHDASETATAAKTEADNLSPRMTKAEASIKTNAEGISTNKINVSALSARMNSAETHIENNLTDIQANAAKITANENDIKTIKADIATIKADITALKDQVAGLASQGFAPSPTTDPNVTVSDLATLKRTAGAGILYKTTNNGGN